LGSDTTASAPAPAPGSSSCQTQLLPCTTVGSLQLFDFVVRISTCQAPLPASHLPIFHSSKLTYIHTRVIRSWPFISLEPPQLASTQHVTPRFPFPSVTPLSSALSSPGPFPSANARPKPDPSSRLCSRCSMHALRVLSPVAQAQSLCQRPRRYYICMYVCTYSVHVYSKLLVAAPIIACDLLGSSPVPQSSHYVASV
jgi:hypothetical protein